LEMLNKTICIIEDVQIQEYMQASTKNQIWFLAISGRSTVQDSGNHYHIKCGTADYQVRKWSALHHHMAFAMLFMLDDRIRHEEPYPLLSCSGIEELLSRFLQMGFVFMHHENQL
jgi:hypothetical protein